MSFFGGDVFLFQNGILGIIFLGDILNFLPR